MRTNKRVGVTILLLFLSAAAIVVLSPGDNTASNTAAVEASSVSSPGTAAMRVYLDPETGEISGSVDPQSAIMELDPETTYALRHDDEGLVVEQHASGASSLNLEGRYQEASFVRVDENGKLVFCAGDVTSAERGLNDTTPTGPEVK